MAPVAESATSSQHITLPVEGMTCAACQANVQRALTKAPGVTRAAVNLMMHEATVEFDPRVTSAQALVDAVNDTGYVSRLPSTVPDTIAEDEAREQAHAREYRVLLRKAVVSLAIGALSMALMPLMGPASAHAVSSPMRYGMLVLTTAVMVWAGGHIYARAWTALRHGPADMNTLIAVGTGAAFIYSSLATVAPRLLKRVGHRRTSTTRPSF